ncbi:MAG: ABC transporter ATP-binding protein [Phycisphaerae bacterium]|jgi:peptide/nickel transport system ATP-binding protein/oligopeptide transport system ATP-binding protein
MEHLLSIKNLSVSFNTDKGEVRAVSGVSCNIDKGKTVALVGESGCGKSVTSLAVLQLLPKPPAEIKSGEVLYNGKDLLSMPVSEIRKLRGKDIAMIFQEPMTSLNPVYTVGEQIAEAILTHFSISSEEAMTKAVRMIESVGISDPARRAGEYPHQMSGGMRQRIMIAMALSCNPRLLIADEPTTALDVTIQAQILELLRDLQTENGMSILLITHDLGVVAENADYVVVMYASKVVETGSVTEIFDNPKHPYTLGLLRSLPRLGSNRKRLDTIPGIVPNPLEFPTGCKFHPRCDLYGDDKRCREVEPPLRELTGERAVACWKVNE